MQECVSMCLRARSSYAAAFPVLLLNTLPPVLFALAPPPPHVRQNKPKKNCLLCLSSLHCCRCERGPAAPHRSCPQRCKSIRPLPSASSQSATTATTTAAAATAAAVVQVEDNQAFVFCCKVVVLRGNGCCCLCHVSPRLCHGATERSVPCACSGSQRQRQNAPSCLLRFIISVTLVATTIVIVIVSSGLHCTVTRSVI